MPRWLLLCTTKEFWDLQFKRDGNMSTTFSRRSKENMPNCGMSGEKRRERASETYEDNERSEECIDYMYRRNFELQNRWEADIVFVWMTHWVEMHRRLVRASGVIPSFSSRCGRNEADLCQRFIYHPEQKRPVLFFWLKLRFYVKKKVLCCT